MTITPSFSEGYKTSQNAAPYYKDIRALHTCLDKVHMRGAEKGAQFEGIMDNAIGNMDEYTQAYMESLPTSKRVASHCAQLQRRIQKGVKLMNLFYKRLRESDLGFTLTKWMPLGTMNDNGYANYADIPVKRLQMNKSKPTYGIDIVGDDNSKLTSPGPIKFSINPIHNSGLSDADRKAMLDAFLGVYATLQSMANSVMGLEKTIYGRKIVSEQSQVVHGRLTEIQL